MHYEKFLALFLLFSTFNAYAVDIHFSNQYTTCLKNKISDSEITDCTIKEATQQDKILTQSYQKLMSSLSGNQKSNLLNSQRAWVKYRELETKRLSEATGGTADAVNASSFYLDFTAQRANEIQSEIN